MSTYACSDLHGRLDFYDEIKKMLKPEDIVFFLGDAGDRGAHSWATIRAVLRDPQFIYIKGNHEDMLINCLEEQAEYGHADYYSLHLLTMNGGAQTFEDAIADPEWEGVLRQLKRLPTQAEYENSAKWRVLLTHAGFTPWVRDNNQIIWPCEREAIWSRDHFYDEWPEDKCCENVVIVHGHTPTPYLAEDLGLKEIEPGAVWYAGGHKCDIDCGAVFSDYCVLLNLDTWDENIFCSN